MSVQLQRVDRAKVTALVTIHLLLREIIADHLLPCYFHFDSDENSSILRRTIRKRGSTRIVEIALRSILIVDTSADITHPSDAIHREMIEDDRIKTDD